MERGIGERMPKNIFKLSEYGWDGSKKKTCQVLTIETTEGEVLLEEVMDSAGPLEVEIDLEISISNVEEANG